MPIDGTLWFCSNFHHMMKQRTKCEASVCILNYVGENSAEQFLLVDQKMSWRFAEILSCSFRP